MRLDYGLFEVQPLTPTIGATVQDVKLGDVDDTMAEAVHAAWMDWKVLFFRNQQITTDEQISFARHFGELEKHPFVVDGETPPEVLVLESTPEMPSSASAWHSDVTFAERPPMGSILRGRIIPPVGGDTLWANMVEAYDQLRDDLKAKIEGRAAVHDFLKAFGRNMSEERKAEALEEHPPQLHPIVRTHPETGEKALFVNSIFTSHIDGMDRAESDILLRQLRDRAKQPEFQCRFRWEPDSVAMWDNRCTQHYASPDFHPAHRRVERVTLTGDRPF